MRGKTITAEFATDLLQGLWDELKNDASPRALKHAESYAAPGTEARAAGFGARTAGTFPPSATAGGQTPRLMAMGIPSTARSTYGLMAKPEVVAMTAPAEIDCGPCDETDRERGAGRVKQTESGAILDPTGAYRYRLWRRWGDERLVTFIMLNPSTADASVDDPTIRRCIGFAKAWGHGGLNVVNLFAYRATNPRALLTALDPVGPENNQHILSLACEGTRLVAAWGANSAAQGSQGRNVRWMLAEFTLWHIGLTKDGHPRHPLYVRADTQPEVWR